MSILNLNRSISLGGRMLDPSEPTQPIIALPRGKQALPVRPTAAPLERVTPEAVGVPSSLVEEFAALLEANDEINAHSLLLLRNGRVFFEHSFGDRDIRCPGYVFSCSKSFVSIAVGMLWDEGKLDLNEDIESIFPDKVGRLARLSPRTVTVSDLLTMTSGASFNEAESMCTEEWIREFITSAAIGENGREFFYNSMNTYMLAAIAVKKSGTDLSEFLKQRLFEPLSITDVFWEKGPEGIEKGGWGLYIRPEDMAKVGIMLQNGGTYRGKRILSEEYVKKATSSHARAPESFGDFNYGYQIWVGRSRDTFLFNGMLGQNMYADRENGIICVVYAGNTDSFQQSEVFGYIKRYLSRDFPDTLPPSPEYKHLMERFGKLPPSFLSKLKSFIFSKKTEIPPQCAALDGTVYRAEKSGSVGFFPFVMQTVFNNYATGIREISFAIKEDTFFLIYKERETTFTIPVGFEKPEQCTADINGDAFLISCRGRMGTDMRGRTTLEIKCEFLELPTTRLITFTFTHHGAEMKQSELPGKKLIGSILRSQSDERPDNVILSTLLEKAGSDTFENKFTQLFEPTVTLKRIGK
ncbi:MAG: serine hydrolase [Clostridia bacterium]|nr:serine hydrolase [Clostridia bacterium]